MSSFASVLERVACIALRRPVPMADSSPPGDRNPGAGVAFSPSGGGRFLLTRPGAGGRRVARGFGSAAGVIAVSGSCSDLKLRFVRRGVPVGVVISCKASAFVESSQAGVELNIIRAV
jgi:hypothetical protein